MAESAPRIVLVGHCGPDSYALRTAVQRAVPGAAVEFAFDEAALQTELGRADLLLVNRLLDGDYTLQTGAELIRKLTAAGGRPATMLVSNYADAQAEAEAAGAKPGFGKREMSSAETKRRILAALGRGG